MSDQYPTHPQGGPAGDPTQAYGGYRPTPTAMSPEDERTWGALSHAGAVVAMIVSAGFLGFLASIAIYVIHKDRGPFVRAHAANSINLQITMFIWWVVVGIAYVVLGIVTLGIGFVAFIPLLFAPPIIAGILHVMGAIKAYNGEWWNPPLTPQIVK
jgi:uncharacterized protein